VEKAMEIASLPGNVGKENQPKGGEGMVMGQGEGHLEIRWNGRTDLRLKRNQTGEEKEQ